MNIPENKYFKCGVVFGLFFVFFICFLLVLCDIYDKSKFSFYRYQVGELFLILGIDKNIDCELSKAEPSTYFQMEFTFDFVMTGESFDLTVDEDLLKDLLKDGFEKESFLGSSKHFILMVPSGNTVFIYLYDLKPPDIWFMIFFGCPCIFRAAFFFCFIIKYIDLFVKIFIKQKTIFFINCLL